MIFLIAEALLTPLISAGSSIVGGVIKHISDRSAIRKMNKYNDPINQVARTRKAGLPAAAMANSGNQTQPAQSGDLGFSQAGGHIGSYITNKKTIEDINKIKADVEHQKLLNEKLQGELQWYRAGAGTDPARTNLSSMLALEQQLKAGTNFGQNIANQISRNTLHNQPLKILLDNQEQRQRISNMIQQNVIGDYHIEGAKLDNALKDLELKWKPRMNTANLNSILLSNDIKLEEKGLKQLERAFAEDTYDMNLDNATMNNIVNKMGMEQYGINYKQNKEYQRLADMARDLWDGEGKKMTAGEFARALGAQFYTIISGVSGSSQIPNLPSINLGDQRKTFTNHHWHND